MLTYPEGMPDDARTRINARVTEGELACLEAAQRPGPLSLPGSGRVAFIWLGKDTYIYQAAVTAAVGTVEEIVAAVPSAGRPTIDDLIEQVVRRFGGYLSSPIEPFRARVVKAVQVAPWWIDFLRRPPAPPPPLPPPPPPPPPAPPTIGEQLTRLREECGWSIDELAVRVGLNRTNVGDHLLDRTRPRLGNLRQYERVFSAELKRPVKLSVERRSPPKRR